jgi:hypothetical protein
MLDEFPSLATELRGDSGAESMSLDTTELETLLIGGTARKRQVRASGEDQGC